MTDPAPSPEAAPRPVPVRPMPRLGHGVHWPAIVAEIDRDEQARQFRSSAEELNLSARDSGPAEPTPSLGEAGSSLGDVRDVLHAEIRSVLGDRPACDHGTADGAYCWPCAQRDRGTELHAYAAPIEPPPAAMHTCADHCQCDQARCGSCADSGHVCENHPDQPWDGISDDISDDINACHCGGAGMPCPECCDPIPEDGSVSIGAAFVPRKFLAPPPAAELLAMADDLNAHGGLDETFVAGLLKAVAGGSEGGDAPDGGPPYTHVHVLDNAEDELPAPTYTINAARVALGLSPFEFPDHLFVLPHRPWWRRALDRVRRWGR